jgi:aryl-alcohol dehydrogenase-like predicted oxidoreductase
VLDAIDGSLRRLGTDYVDLYQLHHPDPHTPIDETLRALDDLVSQGKVRYVGCSNFEPWRTVEALACSRELKIERFISCQNQFSLLAREEASKLLPVLRRYGLGLLPYYPLAGGFLSGKYSHGAPMPEGSRLSYTERLSKRYVNDANYYLSERLTQFSSSRGRSLLDLAFAWLLAHPETPSVIAGATRPEQVEMNVRAGEWVLEGDDMAEIERIFISEGK